MSKVLKLIKDNLILVMMVIVMAIIYGIGMFYNKPWYDELYTYYYFVSKGPVYAGIHWPVPNNHIGYSVLSACLDLVFNPYIGLRGVAYLSSLVNIILVYAIVVRLFKEKIYGYISVVAFSGTYLVYSLAFQGRGYSLTTMCLLIAIYCLVKICCDDTQAEGKRIRKYRPYLVFAISLTLGLYAIPSSLYWVLPTCLLGGFCLLMSKNYKKMRTLIYFSLGAAVATFGLYTIVWLAIGSNLLIKDASTAWYGMGHVSVILHAPFAAFKTGFDYMLATPYIQSVDRSVVITGLWGYMRDLFNLFIGGAGTVITLIMCVAIICSCIAVFKLRKSCAEQKEDFFLAVLVLFYTLLFPIMLIIQSVLPYKRVFSFFGAIWAVSLSFLLKTFISSKIIKRKDAVIKSLYVFNVLLAMLLAFTTYKSNVPLADRENDIEQMLETCMESKGFSPNEIDTIYYTDDYQKYVLKFYYDAEPAETTLEEANFVMVSSDLLKSDGQRDWPMLTTYDDFKFDYVKDEFEVIGGTDKYTLYRRNF